MATESNKKRSWAEIREAMRFWLTFEFFLWVLPVVIVLTVLGLILIFTR